ncbi:hypothetical protein ACFQX6_43850 [Streptosporangium lutulentum]
MSTSPTVTAAESSATGGLTDQTATPARLIDTWFPCPEVDKAVGTPAGSGLSEKALFTWFASRPIAQARAAVLCSLLPDTLENRFDIQAAVLKGEKAAMLRLRSRIAEQYGAKPPVVLDIYSGRGIISLEATRAGATAIGIDLSPVATLAGRLLADYPLRDWSAEPPLPYSPATEFAREEKEAASPNSKRRKSATTGQLGLAGLAGEPRLLGDVRTVLSEVGRRVAKQMTAHYPGNAALGGQVPWAYLWAVTIPCDGCSRRFPLIGSMVLRNPYNRTRDEGQALELIVDGDHWLPHVKDGLPQQQPTFSAPVGKQGKSARCPFPNCGHVHTLDVVKAKGFAGQYIDAMLAVAEIDPNTNRKEFRVPRPDESAAAARADLSALSTIAGLSPFPDEAIPRGNKDNVRASGYGYTTYGSLMNPRQTILFATTAKIIAELHHELREAVSPEYAAALCSYAASNIARQLRRATRGSRKESRGRPDGSAQNRVYSGDVFTNQSTVTHAFDYLEVGPGAGPGTWSSVSSSLLNALRKVLLENTFESPPARLRRASSVALPFRDATIDVIVTDPPYYDMIAYADSSDLSYAWFKRALRGLSRISSMAHSMARTDYRTRAKRSSSNAEPRQTVITARRTSTSPCWPAPLQKPGAYLRLTGT